MSVKPTQVRSLLHKRLQRCVAGETVLVSELRGVAQNRSEEVEVPEGDGTSAPAEEQTESAVAHRQKQVHLRLHLRLWQQRLYVFFSLFMRDWHCSAVLGKPRLLIFSAISAKMWLLCTQVFRLCCTSSAAHTSTRATVSGSVHAGFAPASPPADADAGKGKEKLGRQCSLERAAVSAS